MSLFELSLASTVSTCICSLLELSFSSWGLAQQILWTLHKRETSQWIISDAKQRFLWCCQTWIQVRGEGQWSTNYMSMCVSFAISLYDIVLFSVYRIAVTSLMSQFVGVQMPWESSAQEEKFQFFRQGFLVKWRCIWDHSTVSEILVNLHAEFSIVGFSDWRSWDAVYLCIFVVRALRSLRPARTCATKLLRDLNLHLQPSMPRSWSKLRGWNSWATNRSWFIYIYPINYCDYCKFSKQESQRPKTENQLG